MLEQVSAEALKLRENMDKLHSAGYSQAESDFWDAVTDNGTRTRYEYAFQRWRINYIRPQHKIAPSGSTPRNMFAYCGDLRVIEKDYFDLSKLEVGQKADTSGNYNVFLRCMELEKIEDVGLPAGGYYMTFNNCTSLHTIAALAVVPTTQFQSAFTSCDALANLTVVGTIGQNGFNVGWSPLTHDSLMSIINALETKTDGGSWTITLGSDNIAKLTTEELDIAYEKGWDVL